MLIKLQSKTADSINFTKQSEDCIGVSPSQKTRTTWEVREIKTLCPGDFVANIFW